MVIELYPNMHFRLLETIFYGCPKGEKPIAEIIFIGLYNQMLLNFFMEFPYKS